MNFIQFKLVPGDVIVPCGANICIKATALRNEQNVSDLKIIVKTAGVPVLYHMSDGVFMINNIRENLRYAISADGELSRDYLITVIMPPPLQNLRIEVIPPAYTGLKKTVYGPESTLAAPLNSVVKLRCDSINTVLYCNDKAFDLPFEFNLQETVSLRIAAEHDNLLFKHAWNGNIKAVPDRSPQARFLNPNLNIEAGHGELIAVQFSGEDDYGVARLILEAKSLDHKIILREFKYPEPGIKNCREVFFLRITPELLPADSMTELQITAYDYSGQRASSPLTMTIHFKDLTRQLLNKAAEPDGKCYALLFAAMKLQQEFRQLVSGKTKRFNYNDATSLWNGQIKISGLLKNAHQESLRLNLNQVFQKALDDLHVKDASGLVEQAAEIRRRRNELKLNNLMIDQTLLIEKIQRLINALALHEQNIYKQQMAERQSSAEKDVFEQLKKFREQLNKFGVEQRKILQDTESFDPKKADDWTDAEEKLLGDLATREQEWAQIFKALFNDLSKKQDQDFSNSMMADEFVEIYEELQKAGDALKNKKIEIATLAENTAFDSAKAVAANIERWLSDHTDNIKWIAEEDGKSSDTDLTDLPSELTDIIGELIEQEEDMSEDTSDSSNSFAYDSDEGLGWGVSDGTIDSMQAKGITGNILPNNNEVGGRSGEGRSGKSTGQFVEKEAHGKGGRKTPARLVQSPFEKGTVDDKSTDPQGGATGGGKQSGLGDEGLGGVTPDQTQRKGERLSGNQAELKQRIVTVLKRLEDRNLPTGDIRDALLKISELGQLGDGGGVAARRLKATAAAALRRAQAALDTVAQADREHQKNRIRNPFPQKYRYHEKVPSGYEEYVGQYFKALAVEEVSP